MENPGEVSASTQLKRGQIRPVVSVGTPPSGLGTHRDADVAVACRRRFSGIPEPGRVGGAKVGSHPVLFPRGKGQGTRKKRGTNITERGQTQHVP